MFQVNRRKSRAQWSRKWWREQGCDGGLSTITGELSAEPGWGRGSKWGWGPRGQGVLWVCWQWLFFEELDMEVEVEEEKEEKKNEAEEEDHNGQQKPMMVGETIGNREEWRIKQIRGSVGEWWVHMWVWVQVWKGESLSVSLKSSKAFFFFLRLWN